jgi:hypothetical protein
VVFVKVPLGSSPTKKKKQFVCQAGFANKTQQATSPKLTYEDVTRIVLRPRPDFTSRALIALRLLAETEGATTGAIFFYKDISNDPKILGSTYSFDQSELNFLWRLLAENNFVIPDHQHRGFSVGVAGILEAEKMAATGGEFTQGFVAMSFAREFGPLWTNGFYPAIRNAGYHPFRIDKKDYVRGITDEIITEIRRSRFVVVDYTDQVNGVYFEAGFALGLGRAVIPTCRADQIKELHFDIRHLNTLPWTDPQHLAESLAKRIVTVVGQGPFINESEGVAGGR